MSPFHWLILTIKALRAGYLAIQLLSCCRHRSRVPRWLMSRSGWHFAAQQSSFGRDRARLTCSSGSGIVQPLCAVLR